MNYAIILSGGIGTRMRSDGFPKQYIEVKNKPVIVYTLLKFQENKTVDEIVIVAAKEWQNELSEWLVEFKINKFFAFALPGESRQESILNGLEVCNQNKIDENDKVIIHDGVRPLLSDNLITKCFEEINEHDGCMPVLPVNDTVYQSQNGKTISNLLDRNTLFAGQAPEAFKLKKYFEINKNTEKEILEKTKGSSEIAYNNDFDISLIPGEDTNFKLTTPADLQRFKAILDGENK